MYYFLQKTLFEINVWNYVLLRVNYSFQQVDKAVSIQTQFISPKNLGLLCLNFDIDSKKAAVSRAAIHTISLKIPFRNYLYLNSKNFNYKAVQATTTYICTKVFSTNIRLLREQRKKNFREINWFFQQFFHDSSNKLKYFVKSVIVLT